MTDINELLRASVEAVKRMTPEEREDMLRRQRESWVRGEKNWPKPRYRWVSGCKAYESYADYCA